MVYQLLKNAGSTFVGDHTQTLHLLKSPSPPPHPEKKKKEKPICRVSDDFYKKKTSELIKCTNPKMKSKLD